MVNNPDKRGPDKWGSKHSVDEFYLVQIVSKISFHASPLIVVYNTKVHV